MSTTYNLQILCGPLLAPPESNSVLHGVLEWDPFDLIGIATIWIKKFLQQQKIISSNKKSCNRYKNHANVTQNRSNVTKIDQSDTKSIKVTQNRSKWHIIEQSDTKSIKWHKNRSNDTKIIKFDKNRYKINKNRYKINKNQSKIIQKSIFDTKLVQIEKYRSGPESRFLTPPEPPRIEPRVPKVGRALARSFFKKLM